MYYYFTPVLLQFMLFCIWDCCFLSLFQLADISIVWFAYGFVRVCSKEEQLKKSNIKCCLIQKCGVFGNNWRTVRHNQSIKNGLLDPDYPFRFAIISNLTKWFWKPDTGQKYAERSESLILPYDLLWQDNDRSVFNKINLSKNVSILNVSIVQM